MPARVFIGLREVAGFGRGLKEGFDRLGVESVFLDVGGHPFGYREIGTNPWWATQISSMSRLIGRHFTGGWIRRALWIGIVQNVFALAALPKVLTRYDAFVFVSLSSFCGFIEAPLLKLLGKKTIYVFLGTDARPAYLNGYVATGRGKWAIWRLIVIARVQKLVIAWIERFATHVVNFPPHSQFHSRAVVNGWVLGLPAEFGYSQDSAAQTQATGGAVRILHCPSKPGPKGSDRIRQAVQALQAKGHAIELTEITGRPHAEVLAAIQRCDFVVDELYSDSPLAYFAAEAAYFGKPAVVGSYYAGRVSETLAPEQIPPSLFCQPEEIEASIERLVRDAEFRRDLGRKAQSFVRERWSASAVAERYLALIEGRDDPSWKFDPGKIRYVEGCGLSRQAGREIIRELLMHGGRKALSLGDKPELEALFEGLAREGDGPRL